MKTLTKKQLVELDVRPLFALGKDPLQEILTTVKTIQHGQVLKIINSFEPTPLMALLAKKGFETYADPINKDLVETYFYKRENNRNDIAEKELAVNGNWDSFIKKFEGHIQEVDVRHLEMPQPMHTILENLDTLPKGNALYVYHKRIPVFLLPELAERGYDYRVNEIKDGDVRLLIFRN